MKNACLLVVALFISFPAFGAAIGQPQRTSMVGYSIGAGYVSVDDPLGDTERAWALQPATLIYTARLRSGLRYWSGLYYYKTSLDAATDRIGQEVEQFGLRLSVQKSLPVTSRMSTWVGAGIGVSQERFSLRHIVDNEGFLLKRYPDRRNTGVALILNFVGDWPVSRTWNMGIMLEQAITVAGDIGGTRGSLVVLYKY